MRRALILLGSYSRARPHEPEIYTDAIAATLAGYPPEIIEHVTDPRTGIQRTLKWLPEVAEVVEACEGEIVRRRKAKRIAEVMAREAAKPKRIDPPRNPERDAEMAQRFQLLLRDMRMKEIPREREQVG